MHAYFLEKGTPEMRNWHGKEKSRQHIRHMEHLDITNAKLCTPIFLEKGTPEMRNRHGEEKSRQHIRHMEHLDITNAKACRYH